MVCDDGKVKKVRKRASFKGASFHIDSTSESYGRRIVTHEFPLLDTPVNEDMGGKAISISMDGYLTGNGWLSDRDALIAACSSYGSGTLIHPFYDYPILCVCNEISVSETKDELGRVKVSMKFTQDTAFAGGGLSLGFLTVALGGAVDALFDSAINLFELRLNLNGGDRVFDASSDALRSGVSLMDEARLLAVVDSGKGPKLKRDLERLHGGWDIVVRGGRKKWRQEIKDILNGLRTGVKDKKSLSRVLKAAANLDRDFRPASAGSSGKIAADAARAEAGKLIRRMTGAVMGEAAALAVYNNRSESTMARNQFAQWHQVESSLFDPLYEHESWQPLDTVRSKAIDVFEKNSLTTVDTVKITLPAQTTAMAVAQRLYGDPSRFEEIWLATGSAHPSFIRGTIEVSSR
jgi:prophage DNA circulation protein